MSKTLDIRAGDRFETVYPFIFACTDHQQWDGISSLMSGGLVVVGRHLNQLIAVMAIKPFTQRMRKEKESLRFCLSQKCQANGSAELSTPATSLTRTGGRGKAGRPIR
ncbi:hypothetical protein [Klebsiella pneumoniae]